MLKPKSIVISSLRQSIVAQQRCATLSQDEALSTVWLDKKIERDHQLGARIE
jgi:hypothetical protein